MKIYVRLSKPNFGIGHGMFQGKSVFSNVKRMRKMIILLSNRDLINFELLGDFEKCHVCFFLEAIGRFYARDVKVVWTTLTSKTLKASGIKTRRI